MSCVSNIPKLKLVPKTKILEIDVFDILRYSQTFPQISGNYNDIYVLSQSTNINIFV